MDLPSSTAVSLTDLIRAAVVEKHPWERIQHQSVGAIQDSEIASSIAPFAEQIQSKMKDLDRNLTSLLEEFDDVFPNYSTAVSVDWDANEDEKDELWYHPSLHGSSYPIESFNYSLVGSMFLYLDTTEDLKTFSCTHPFRSLTTHLGCTKLNKRP